MSLREPPQRAAWVLNLYPEAGEAGGCFVPSRRPTRIYSPAGAAKNPERAGAEAARRAKGQVRRYCAGNRLNRFGTLTYGPPRCTDPREVRTHVGAFFRELRSGLGGDALPYVWVPELHKDGKHFPRPLCRRALRPSTLDRLVLGSRLGEHQATE